MAQGKQTGGNKAASAQLFSDYSALRHIWTHPYILYLNKIRQANKMLYDSDESFIDDASTHSESDENIICLENPEPGTSSKMNDDDSSEKEVIKKWETRRQGREEIQDEDEEKDWWSDILPLEENKKIELSGKLVLFLEVLNRSEEIGDKVLLFSQSLLLLDMLEDILKMKSVENSAKSDQQTGYYGTWVPGVDYFRMDGCTNAENRKRWIDHFNDDEDSRCRLFLVSTKAGSLGTNLVGANRVIIIDTSWNPSHDTQAIFRVYRFGQKKPVYIYRFLAQGTMEEKIYDRQVTKLSLSCRVVDDQQIERHFNAADLEELYSFEPDSKSKRPTPMVPKDRLLADLLYQHANWIVSYHEHDSLLLNNPEEELTEEECQSAWQEYEAERKGIKNNLNFEFEATSSQEMPQKSNREKDSFNAQYNTNSEFQEVTQQIGNMVRMIKSKDLYQTPEQVHKNVMSSIYVTRNILQRQQVELLHKRQEFVTTQQPIPYDLAEKIQSTGRKIHAFNIYEHYWQNQTPVVRQNQQFQQVYQRKLSGFPNSSYQFLQKQQGYSNPNTQDHYPPSKVPNRNFPTFVHDPDVQWRFTQVGTARVPQAIFPSGVTITPVLSGSNSENIENIKSRPIITEVDDTENIPSQSCKTPSSVTIEEI